MLDPLKSSGYEPNMKPPMKPGQSQHDIANVDHIYTKTRWKVECYIHGLFQTPPTVASPSGKDPLGDATIGEFWPA